MRDTAQGRCLMNALKHDLLDVPQDTFDLFDKNKSVDTEKVRNILSFQNKDVAVASGLRLNSIRYDEKMPKELEVRLIEWATLINLLGTHFDSLDKTILWLKTPNPFLGGVSPRKMIIFGRYKKLFQFVTETLSQNYK